MLKDIYKRLADLPNGKYAIQSKFLFINWTHGYISVERDKDGKMTFMTTSHENYHYRIADFACFNVVLNPDLSECIFARYYAVSFWDQLGKESYKEESRQFYNQLKDKTFKLVKQYEND